MQAKGMNLTFRSDIVWPWGLFFSELAELLKKLKAIDAIVKQS